MKCSTVATRRPEGSDLTGVETPGYRQRPLRGQRRHLHTRSVSEGHLLPRLRFGFVPPPPPPPPQPRLAKKRNARPADVRRPSPNSANPHHPNLPHPNVKLLQPPRKNDHTNPAITNTTTKHHFHTKNSLPFPPPPPPDRTTNTLPLAHLTNQPNQPRPTVIWATWNRPAFLHLFLHYALSPPPTPPPPAAHPKPPPPPQPTRFSFLPSRPPSNATTKP